MKGAAPSRAEPSWGDAQQGPHDRGRGGARAAAPTRVDARALQLLRLMETALEREHAGVCAHAHTHTHLRSVSPRVRPQLGT